MQSTVRKHPRVQSANLVYVTNVAIEGEELVAITRELGAGGCKLVAGRTLGEGRMLMMGLTLGARTLRIIGKVLHEHEEAENRHVAGIEFVFLNPEDGLELKSFVNRHLAALKSVPSP